MVLILVLVLPILVIMDNLATLPVFLPRLSSPTLHALLHTQWLWLQWLANDPKAGSSKLDVKTPVGCGEPGETNSRCSGIFKSNDHT